MIFPQLKELELDSTDLTIFTQKILSNPGQLATKFTFLDVEVSTQQLLLSKHWKLRELTKKDLKLEGILSEFYNAVRDMDCGVASIKNRGTCFEIDNEDLNEMKFLPVNDSQSLVDDAPQIIITFSSY
ncbi:hypothetical protein V1514DRAFT_341890 [Lipomyces japonicus]|uniref:uncharacterized protein n=1 Tax=Lipomyces japonicus TaxID=56871 RepID=UPI0034D00D8B